MKINPEKLQYQENKILKGQKGGNLINKYDSVSSTIARLKTPEVDYMELKESNFRCGECSFNINGYCNNKSVQSNVNLEKGCCNFYIPQKNDEIDSAN